MNILILTLSPAGSTLKISKLLEQKLVSKGHVVQLLDITANKSKSLLSVDNKTLLESR